MRTATRASTLARSFVLVVLVCTAVAANLPTISTNWMLVPHQFAGRRVAYPLRATDGEFEVTRSAEGSIRIEVVNERSEKNGILLNIYPVAPGNTEIILKDTRTQRVLSCRVVVEAVHEMKLLTRTRVMFRDDIEEISVQGFDRDGNTFSSLDGMRFIWTMEDLAPIPSALLERNSDGSARLDFVDDMGAMVSHGGEWWVSVNARATGRVNLSVRLDEPGYENVPGVNATITILEPLKLDPSGPLFIAPGSVVHFRLLTRDPHQGGAFNPFNVVVRSLEYAWHAHNGTVLRGLPINGAASVNVTGGDIGATTIYVTSDTTIPGHEVSCNVTVAEIKFVRLSIQPRGEDTDSNWHIVRGREYTITAHGYDAYGHQIYHSLTSTGFTIKVDGAYLGALGEQTRNTLDVSALKTGNTTVEVTMTMKYTNGKTQSLTGSAEAFITEQVTVAPWPMVLLAWPRNLSMLETYQLTATGGSGAYAWHPARLVDNNGVVGGFGMDALPESASFDVTVMDAKNSDNSATTAVVVAPVARYNLTKSLVQVEVGAEVRVPVIAYTATDVPFHNCSEIAAAVELSGSSFRIVKERDTEDGACFSVVLIARHRGEAKLAFSVPRFKTLELTLYAFEPLEIKPQSLVLAIGSSWDLKFVNGPHRAGERTESMSKPAHDHVTLQAVPPATEADGSLEQAVTYRATCRTLGTESFTLDLRYMAEETFGAKNFKIVSQTVNVTCAVPVAVDIELNGYEDVENPDCGATSRHGDALPRWDTLPIPAVADAHPPRLARAGPFLVLHGVQQVVRAALFTQDRRLFHNYSSVVVAWESLSTALAMNTGQGDGKHQEWRNARTIGLEPVIKTGDLQITVTGYTHAAQQQFPATLKEAKIEPFAGRFTFELRPRLTVTPPLKLAFWQASNKVVVVAAGGSAGANPNSPAITLALSSNHSHAVIQNHSITVPANEEGTYQVEVRDTCIPPAASAFATVVVTHPVALKIRTQALVEVGTKVPLFVDAYDALNRRFDPDQSSYLNITVRPKQTEMVSVTPAQAFHSERTLHAQVIGVEYVDAWTDFKGVSSTTARVTVFAPLAFVPSQIVLVCGSRQQFQVSRGPPGARQITYRSHTTDIIDCENSGHGQEAPGLLKSKALGTGNITARAEGVDETLQQRVVYSEAALSVPVVEMKDLVIVAPSRIVVGEEVSIHVAAHGGLVTAIAFAGLEGLTATWTNSKPDFASIEPVREHYEFDEARMLRAKLPGVTVLTVTVHVPDAGPHCPPAKNLTASWSIEVVPALELVVPNKCHPVLLLTRNSQACIVTTAPDDKTLTYKVFGANAMDARIATIDTRGCIQTYDLTGTVFVTVRSSASQMSAVVTVTVAMVAQLVVHPTPGNAEVGGPSIYHYAVTLHDEMGRTFSVNAVPLELYSSLNIISYEISTLDHALDRQILTVRGTGEGDAVLRVSVPDNSVVASKPVFDEVWVHFEQHISPDSPRVHLGGEVTFALDDKNAQCQWLLRNAHVGSLDSDKGVFRAQGVGCSDVVCDRINVDEGFTASTHVCVTRIAHTDATLPDLLCNANITHAAVLPADESQVTVSLPLSFLDDEHHVLARTDDEVHHQAIHYECRVAPGAGAAAVSSARAAVVDGRPVCQLQLAPPAVTVSLAQPVSSVAVEVRAGDRDHSYVATSTLRVPFASAFLVDIEGPNQTLSLAPLHTEGFFTVLGARDPTSLRIYSSKTFIETEMVSQSAANTAPRLRYRVVVPQGKSEPFGAAHVTIEHLTTHQIIHVTVQWTWDGEEHIPVTAIPPAPIVATQPQAPSSMPQPIVTPVPVAAPAAAPTKPQPPAPTPPTPPTAKPSTGSSIIPAILATCFLAGALAYFMLGRHRNERPRLIGSDADLRVSQPIRVTGNATPGRSGGAFRQYMNTTPGRG